MTEMHAVFATSPDSRTFRVSDPLSYDKAVYAWTKLDDLRRDGRTPHVKFFEVRAVFVGPDRPLVGPTVTSHDRYDGAPLDLLYATPVATTANNSGRGRGYARVEDAARAAWKRAFPTFRSWLDKRMRSGERTGVQGRGGWFYWPNGQTAAQGLDGLARVCKSRRMVVQGADGRWYVTEPEA